MEKLLKYLVITAIILSVVSMGVSAYLTNRIGGGKWVCQEERCVEFTQSVEWMEQHCGTLPDSDMVVCTIEDENGIHIVTVDKFCKKTECNLKGYMKVVGE